MNEQLGKKIFYRDMNHLAKGILAAVEAAQRRLLNDHERYDVPLREKNTMIAEFQKLADEVYETVATTLRNSHRAESLGHDND